MTSKMKIELPPTIRDCHQSGKFSVDVDVLLERLDHLVALGYEIIRLTEVSSPKFRKPLEAWAKANNFHIYHPRRSGANECAILAKNKISRRFSWQATKFALKVGRKAPTWVVSCRVDGAGQCFVLHTPAHNDGLKKGLWPTRVYYSIIDSIKRRIKFKRETWSADFNVDLRRDNFKGEIEHNWFRGLTLAVSKNQKPTEGGRVIDGFATTDEVVQSGVTETAIPGGQKHLDHLPVGIKRRRKIREAA